MKKSLIVLFTILAAACTARTVPVSIPSPEDVVMYQINPRNFAPEQSFKAVDARLDAIKDLGTNVVWFMPICEIGIEKAVKSPYCVKDYKAVNPEFGTLEDFKTLVAHAHEKGMAVIIDWVANHTSPDHPWVTGKDPSWYVRDAEGKTIVEYDWTDIAKLNYANKDMRSEMEKSLRFWLDRGIDGFRCDVAFQVPQDFWADVFTKFRNEYSRRLFFLAEGEEAWLHEAGFDCTYAWKLHHLLNDIAQGKANADSLVKYVEWNAQEYWGAKRSRSAHRLMFITNHDENSWNGTEFERLGDAWQVMEVLNFTLPKTQPLIYTGQEIGLDRRLEFFEKDPVTDWSANEYTDFYKYLTALRHDNPALAAGERGGKMKWIETGDPDVLAFSRRVRGNKVTVFANLSAEPSAPIRGLRSDSTPDGILPAWGWEIIQK